MILLIPTVCASRIGLWVFDISVTQLMQEFIPEGIRGTIGGTQHALNAFFQLSGLSLGFIFTSPEQYGIFALSGCISVGFAAGIYSLFVFRRKDNFQTQFERQHA
jgi:solute carrier family 40 (iron-regulated transporter), member 1